jgi:hypothetical protein
VNVLSKTESSLENDLNVNNSQAEDPSNENKSNLISKNLLGSSIVTGVKLEKVN